MHLEGVSLGDVMANMIDDSDGREIRLLVFPSADLGYSITSTLYIASA